MTNVHIFITDFGTPAQRYALAERINSRRNWSAYIDDAGNVIILMTAEDIGDFVSYCAVDEELNWVEYRFQIET